MVGEKGKYGVEEEKNERKMSAPNQFVDPLASD
jgi:hypothetical protein